MNPDADEQYLEDLVNGTSTDDKDILKNTALNVMFEEYKQIYANIVKARENATEYDDLDTL